MRRINGKSRKPGRARQTMQVACGQRDTMRDVDGDEMNPGSPAVASTVPDAFHVHDESSANWLVRRVRECRDYAQRVTAWAAAEVRGAEAEERWLLERFGHQLEQWVRQRLEQDPSPRGRTRSVSLPAGVVGLRSEPPRLVVVDEARVLAWCRSNLPGALKAVAEAEGAGARRLAAWAAQCPQARVSESFSKSALNAHAAASGELPEGADLAPAGERFYVK